jgi:hypothetical protein
MPDLHNPPEQSNRRERLLKVWHLALVALITLLALALVASTSYPMEATGGRLDGLALQHLRLLVAVRTKDGNLKLRLAQALFATGQLQEASKLLDSSRSMILSCGSGRPGCVFSFIWRSSPQHAAPKRTSWRVSRGWDKSSKRCWLSGCLRWSWQSLQRAV